MVVFLDFEINAYRSKENVRGGYQFKFRMLQFVGAILCRSASIEDMTHTQSN